MIIDYEDKYEEDVKDLLVELQEYLAEIDDEKYNIITNEYREEYFKKTLEEVNKYNGKILLYENNNKIVGLIVGIINNDEISTYDFKAPKRGRITELITKKNIRTKGIGTKLICEMENHLKKEGCKDILIGVFGYNKRAIEFYKKKGYKTRMVDMTKKIIDK